MQLHGTAGHINPAIAIANKIKEKQNNSEIIFIGTTRGLENDLVPRAGYKLKTIDAYGLSKKISIDNLSKIAKTIKGISQAKKIVKEFKPDIVIGTGGYICGAAILAAKKYNVPAVLHESNAFPGKAVKMLSKNVDKILLGFEKAKDKLPEQQKAIVTGNPTKTKKIKYSLNEKIEKLKKLKLEPIKPVVLVFGGSQGAQKINETIIQIIKEKKNKNYQIIWAAGPKQYDNIKLELENSNIDINNISGINVVPYIYNMEEVMNLADIVVARSGALTITEIAAVGKASILIPLPNVSENHQEYNAKVLESINAAYIIKNDEINGDILNNKINEIIQEKGKIEDMGKNAEKVYMKNVEEIIYNEIIKITSI